MCKRVLMVLIAVLLAGCGSPANQQATAKPPAAPQNTELRDAAQAPLERAQAVQQTLDERAAKLDAETRAALDQGADPNEDPNAKKDDDDGQGDEE